MKLSNLKPGDKFFMQSFPVIEFTFINARPDLFFIHLEPEWFYLNNRFELYVSDYDYEVIQKKEVPLLTLREEI